jgi:tyrosyl-DNA phosphodiesterase-1
VGKGKRIVEMVPVFGRDIPTVQDVGTEAQELDTEKVFVGLRMPYDLPLEPYGEDEVPWCATMAHHEPDWMGRVWEG